MRDTSFRYKVRPRGKWDWREFDTVRMEISIGQAYHEDVKLKVAMDWARDNFKRVVLIIGDLPQRYNLMYLHSYDELRATQIARAAGTDWLRRNSAMITSAEITRWEDWKRKPDYLVTRATVSRLYMENDRFRATIQDAMTDFSARHHIEAEDLPRYFQLTEQYLLEETAVFATAYDELGGISAYPGGFLETWEACIYDDDPVIPKGLKKAFWTRITFEKQRLTG